MNQISLEKLPENKTAEIISIIGGRIAAKRLADLGMVHGAQIKILKEALLGGPIEVELKGSKLVLGRGLAAKILVKPI